MLLRRDTLDGIADGRVTLAFRRWERPRVKPGTRLRTAIGVVEVTSVDPVRGRLTAADARAAGFPTIAALKAKLDGRAGIVYRVALRPAGPDPRVALREDPELDDAGRAELDARLARLDAASRRGPWTSTVLALIAQNPAVRAPDLAARLGRETAPFKRDVRKLKELGLTESLETGYRLSPRGESYLRR
ncbi:MAG: hypothetical protein OJJ54_10010 [Pseudonocardia sp.]|nr:hypothetical protein [Pseudonocardia sp.]